LQKKPDVILLDDAYQHRKVQGGLYMLTTHNDLYCDDYMLPTGNLRESRSKRAKVVIITKCPSGLAIEEQDSIRMKPNLDKSQELYFSFKYDDFVFSEHDSITRED
jgi:tetraacyldisaccharide 4'-kinase